MAEMRIKEHGESDRLTSIECIQLTAAAGGIIRKLSPLYSRDPPVPRNLSVHETQPSPDPGYSWDRIPLITTGTSTSISVTWGNLNESLSCTQRIKQKYWETEGSLELKRQINNFKAFPPPSLPVKDSIGWYFPWQQATKDRSYKMIRDFSSRKDSEWRKVCVFF